MNFRRLNIVWSFESYRSWKLKFNLFCRKSFALLRRRCDKIIAYGDESFVFHAKKKIKWAITILLSDRMFISIVKFPILDSCLKESSIASENL